METKQATIAEQIKSWRADIRICESGEYPAVRIYAYAWNWLTSPSRMMTDREHRVCGKMAKRVYAKLKDLPGWHHMESGLIWI